ncbi:MAG TPA: CpsD/CapB family tyrosine-protein kinase [Bryobacteraceae bacterium]|nr:CpsD/CapB family tyrosine-protein kinase [Bryobacteraceae bacterium]
MSSVQEALVAAARPASDPVTDGLLCEIPSLACRLSPDALAIDPLRPGVAPIEEFRALRTRLNHLQQSRSALRAVVITSASPAEGKSFTAANLALAQAQLAGNRVLLCDFDFRRPAIHKTFLAERSPGLTDYLLGTVPLQYAMRRLGDGNLFVMPAGTAVTNPLELLNLPSAKELLQRLRGLFNWILLDSPPLLFAADANLLATLCDATILVVRIGASTIDSFARARQCLCEDNVIGIVVNGASRSELYSKYSCYHAYSSSAGEEPVTAASRP